MSSPLCCFLKDYLSIADSFFFLSRYASKESEKKPVSTQGYTDPFADVFRLFPDYTVELMYYIFHAILDCFLITVELKYHIFSCYQLEVKPNPHPERPDRLRAIAASLSAAGAYNRLPLLIQLFD